MSDLLTIDGIGSDEVELLEATGWTDLQAVAKADVDVLLSELTAANAMLRIVPRIPERKKVERWVASATLLLDPATAPVSHRLARSTAVAAAPAPDKKAAKSKGGRRSKAAAKAAEAAEPVAAEAPAAEAAPAEDASGEAQLAQLSGPVNFEADEDVLVMLAVAPLALPIPARLLAEKGIAPSEIAVAPLLNRAMGDLEVRVSAEKPERIPDAPNGSRRANATASVQVSDLGLSMGRRGIDASRIRTIEEAQGDAPPVRASSSKAGMEDDRINLLRAPRQETNKGRNPASRFYIRGVLHDQPLKVWFGGLFALLLQISIPLAVVAAPLLILHGEKPEKFAWVPEWIIAFPLAIPVFGILYALVSARAKCRVCAQRLYVPKHCLKNKKAHHVPMMGYIGGLALHVIVFKWFNCTFCGTSIRIKK